MNRIIITGGPGFGKTSIINDLEDLGYHVFHEFSRQIIEEQNSTGGDVVPWKDHHAFNDALFKGRLEQFHAANAGMLHFYDRGLPDSLAYLRADEKEIPVHYSDEAKSCSYYHHVFITPVWQEIYCKDQQRWEEMEYAKKIHTFIADDYSSMGYNIVEIPKLPVRERSEFILSFLKKDFPEHIR